MLQPVDYYRQSIATCTARISSLKEKIFWISMGRLVSFLLIIVTISLFIREPGIWIFSTVALSIILFTYLLRVSINLSTEKNLTQHLLFINTNEMDMLNGESNRFDNGASLPSNSIYSSDLDILGENSLYHYLNRTVTIHGATRLSALLNHPFTQVNSIVEHQAAVKHLSSQQEVRQMITAKALLRNKNEGSIAEINEWINTKGKLTGNKPLQFIKFILPIFNISAFLYYLDTDKTPPLLAGIALSWIIIGIYGKYINRQHTMIGRKQAVLDQYAFILDEFHRSDAGDSPLLKKLHNISSTGKHEVRRLSKLTGFFDQRLNLLVNFLLNSFLLYDIHCALALEKWKNINRHRFNEWIDAVGEIEMISSLAAFAYNHPRYCFPVITGGKPVIRAKNMSHPLIPASESVANDFTLGENEKLTLVTGSNMSGKSTFLRTAGINLLLAQCGAPVSATEFECSPVNVLSSIRISDSLQEHTSYFMAELRRLREIISVLETGEPALVLIDEVLRGTNSNDKTHGSEALIKKLIAYNCICLFATHDLSLSELEHIYPAAISNYCFESSIENGELLFDYKLREGIATNKNATFLMQKMGIISA